MSCHSDRAPPQSELEDEQEKEFSGEDDERGLPIIRSQSSKPTSKTRKKRLKLQVLCYATLPNYDVVCCADFNYMTISYSKAVYFIRKFNIIGTKKQNIYKSMFLFQFSFEL